MHVQFVDVIVNAEHLVDFADDHSRVILEKIEEDVDSDYINASYIDVSLFCYSEGCYNH